MKRFFYAISIVLLLVGCSKEEPISHTTHTAPTPIMVTMQELIGTWVFEDALYAAKTAKANGYNVVGIYDKSEPNQEELKEVVDIYINDYSELELI